jgi:excisionase family DNA binding protein
MRAPPHTRLSSKSSFEGPSETGGLEGATKSPPPPRSPASRHPLLRVSDVAARLNCSVKTVRRLIARSELEVSRVGRLLRISEAALAAYLGRASRR